MSDYKTVVDQMGRKVSFSFPPRRIISLVPSQTELLFDLGLDSEVVGVTKFCIYPSEKIKNVPKIGGTKSFNFKRIEELKPDLIIGNKEENYEEGINTLEKKYPVWMSDILNLEHAQKMISEVGKLVDKEEKANEIQSKIQKIFEIYPTKKRTVAYIIWKNPLMVAAKNTFIDEMLSKAGFENCFKHLTRYPAVTIDELRLASPDFIFLSSEPFPFKKKHIPEFISICEPEKIKLVDGEIFSWYGSRLLKAEDYFHNLNSELQRL